VHHTIIIWKNGKSFAYQRASEKQEFAKKVIKKIKEDDSFTHFLCKKLKEKTDAFVEFVKKWKGKPINLNQFLEYHNILYEYYRYHITIKVLVDFLPQDMLEKYLPNFEEARIYAEPVFTESIEFMKALSELIEKDSSYPAELIRSLTKEEFETFLKTKELPPKDILIARKLSAFLFIEGKTNIITGTNVSAVEKLLAKDQDSSTLKGTTAYKGKVQGKVCIIEDPSKAEHFEENNILVTGMTRPEYLHLMKKSAAIVTDAGGILSHAAIVARELKKPCVIGTNNATKVLKDGMNVEVDADNGIVKII
tara:strand:- start:1447 stop:2370 length:924 start_codon:yes stop_codon:yes gene_type:complete